MSSKKLDAAIDALVDALAELPEHELEGWQRGNRLGLRILCELARRYPGIVQADWGPPVRRRVGLSCPPRPGLLAGAGWRASRVSDACAFAAHVLAMSDFLGKRFAARTYISVIGGAGMVRLAPVLGLTPALGLRGLEVCGPVTDGRLPSTSRSGRRGHRPAWRWPRSRPLSAVTGT